MKDISIHDFVSLEDAMTFLEDALWYGDDFGNPPAGEIKLINGKWRVGLTYNLEQGDLFDDA